MERKPRLRKWTKDVTFAPQRSSFYFLFVGSNLECENMHACLLQVSHSIFLIFKRYCLGLRLCISPILPIMIVTLSSSHSQQLLYRHLFHFLVFFLDNLHHEKFFFFFLKKNMCVLQPSRIILII